MEGNKNFLLYINTCSGYASEATNEGKRLGLVSRVYTLS